VQAQSHCGGYGVKASDVIEADIYINDVGRTGGWSAPLGPDAS